MSAGLEDDTIDWLLAGDPVIRWQVQRDLSGEAEHVWSKERARTVETGWGRAFLDRLSDGGWPDGRWTGTVWTLLQLMDCGLPPDHRPLASAARLFIDKNFPISRAADPKWLKTRVDLCHLGFWLRIGNYFAAGDTRMADLAPAIIEMQMPDGGFNCQIRNKPYVVHSSFHTTFNVLEGLAEAHRAGAISKKTFRDVEASALEFMLCHQLYRSDRTGAVISERFTHLSYPSHWHYTVLRGLDYMRHTLEIRDARLSDPIELIVKRRKSNGRWIVEKRIPGTEHFDMERQGGESRWNTLRALRVMKAREGSNQPQRG